MPPATVLSGKGTSKWARGVGRRMLQISSFVYSIPLQVDSIAIHFFAVCQVSRILIRSFKSKALERFWLAGDVRGLNQAHVARIAVRLAALNAAAKPEDMNVPGLKFHALKGKLTGRYAVWVSGNWRITFAWDDDGPAAIDVDDEDYH